ncbi:nagb/rpia/CoA transferase-like protein [Amniculicola lignicola CBS 123094]|uniref:Translation initiation factor eIF2B subunit delta n=1 Tax=Amniculicola lignicola CBS 123094 TaxID=1392246 RepID=A0A6A5VX67_9PLEO|nr:nagb/rpia/CoA transferase-like protein [Amniculicola lignicola CBS 123094]
MDTTPDGAAPPEAPATAAEPSSNPPPQAPADPKNVQSTEADTAPKLSPAELKKRKQAEKQAKRAQAKSSVPQTPAQQKGPLAKEGQKQQKDSKNAKADLSKPFPVRRRPSQGNTPVVKEVKVELKKDKQDRGLFFGHLYNQPRQHSMVGASKDVNPAILALGLQYSNYIICGSTARMVAMLLAFKTVIEQYHTPVGTSLARHLTAHHLNPQIDYLRSCRPLSISMGNAIRWLKDLIIKIDPDVPEDEAKRDLQENIDYFIRDRVTLADDIITSATAQKINSGDVIMTYASSSVVEKTLIRAHQKGIDFSVIVIDSKPLFEGKQLARKLANHGIRVKYLLITGAAHAIKEASKVFLGAHAMMSNGRLYSRIGTALVAMLASSNGLPVIVLCESVKFTERVALDSIVGNEAAPAEEILSEAERRALLPLKPYLHTSLLPKDDTKDTPAKGNGEVLEWVDNSDNFQMLQLLYDVTPANYINMVITEYGSLPPSSVPVVHRLSTHV